MEKRDYSEVALMIVGLLSFFGAIVCGHFGATIAAIVLIAVFGVAMVAALGVGFFGK